MQTYVATTCSSDSDLRHMFQMTLSKVHVDRNRCPLYKGTFIFISNKVLHEWVYIGYVLNILVLM